MKKPTIILYTNKYKMEFEITDILWWAADKLRDFWSDVFQATHKEAEPKKQFDTSTYNYRDTPFQEIWDFGTKWTSRFNAPEIMPSLRDRDYWDLPKNQIALSMIDSKLFRDKWVTYADQFDKNRLWDYADGLWLLWDKYRQSLKKFWQEDIKSQTIANQYLDLQRNARTYVKENSNEALIDKENKWIKEDSEDNKLKNKYMKEYLWDDIMNYLNKNEEVWNKVWSEMRDIAVNKEQLNEREEEEYYDALLKTLASRYTDNLDKAIKDRWEAAPIIKSFESRKW